MLYSIEPGISQAHQIVAFSHRSIAIRRTAIQTIVVHHSSCSISAHQGSSLHTNTISQIVRIGTHIAGNHSIADQARLTMSNVTAIGANIHTASTYQLIVVSALTASTTTAYYTSHSTGLTITAKTNSHVVITLTLQTVRWTTAD